MSSGDSIAPLDGTAANTIRSPGLSLISQAPVWAATLLTKISQKSLEENAWVSPRIDVTS